MSIEKWMLVNLSDKAISPGFLNMTVVRPGKSKDLIGADVTMAEVLQSQTIKTYIEKGMAKIERMIDGELFCTITADNIHELNDIPQTNNVPPKKGKLAKAHQQDLSEKAPSELHEGKFTIYKEGENLVIHAKDKDGKTVTAVLGKFA